MNSYWLGLIVLQMEHHIVSQILDYPVKKMLSRIQRFQFLDLHCWIKNKMFFHLQLFREFFSNIIDHKTFSKDIHKIRAYLATDIVTGFKDSTRPVPHHYI